jgi:hypothetical protein
MVLMRQSPQQLDQALDAGSAIWPDLSWIESASPDRSAARKRVVTINQIVGEPAIL